MNKNLSITITIRALMILSTIDNLYSGPCCSKMCASSTATKTKSSESGIVYVSPKSPEQAQEEKIIKHSTANLVPLSIYLQNNPAVAAGLASATQSPLVSPEQPEAPKAPRTFQKAAVEHVVEVISLPSLPAIEMVDRKKELPRREKCKSEPVVGKRVLKNNGFKR